MADLYFNLNDILNDHQFRGQLKSAVVSRVYSSQESTCTTTLPRLQFPGDLNESAGTVSRSRAAMSSLTAASQLLLEEFIQPGSLRV